MSKISSPYRLLAPKGLLDKFGLVTSWKIFKWREGCEYEFCAEAVVRVYVWVRHFGSWIGKLKLEKWVGGESLRGDRQKNAKISSLRPECH